MNKQIINIEIKAKCFNSDLARDILIKLKAEFKGVDHQIDTYFNCENGRLKLRNGNIENSLIFYQRSNQKGPKKSMVSLTRLNKENNLKETLSMAYGIKVEVHKKRGIYFIDNVKFHVDEVDGLGSFIEIEAIDNDGGHGEAKLLKQCQEYMKILKIAENDLIDRSYSDLLLP